jgi:hypothetical protein
MGKDLIEYYTKKLATAIEAELVLRCVGVSWDTHPSKRIRSNYVFDRKPEPSAKGDISARINKDRENAISLMMQIANDIQLRNYKIKNEHANLELYATHHANAARS